MGGTAMTRTAMFDAARDTVLASVPDVLAIYLYGSYAKDQEWPDSDLDIAVLLAPGASIPDPLGAAGEIAWRVGRDVDLVDLREVGDFLRYEVLDSGKPLYTADPERVLAWEASAMSQYARHCEDIAGILDDFNRTGIAYVRDRPRVNREELMPKIESLQRSVSRAREERARSGNAFATDYTAQDAALLNVLRACETSIHLANMLIRQQRLGIPTESRNSFTILAREGIIGVDLAKRLHRMVGFRNTAVHQYEELDMQVVEAVIDSGLDDVLALAEAVQRLLD